MPWILQDQLFSVVSKPRIHLVVILKVSPIFQLQKQTASSKYGLSVWFLCKCSILCFLEPKQLQGNSINVGHTTPTSVVTKNVSPGWPSLWAAATGPPTVNIFLNCFWSTPLFKGMTTDCWVCGAMPLSSSSGLPWKIAPKIAHLLDSWCSLAAGVRIAFVVFGCCEPLHTWTHGYHPGMTTKSLLKPFYITEDHACLFSP